MPSPLVVDFLTSFELLTKKLKFTVDSGWVSYDVLPNHMHLTRHKILIMGAITVIGSLFICLQARSIYAKYKANNLDVKSVESEVDSL